MKLFIKATSLAVLLFSLNACDKKLDIQPKQSIDATTAIQTPEDLEAAVVGAYSIMGGGALYGTDLFLVPELLGSETYAQWRGTFQSFRQVANKTMTRDNGEASRIWIAGYRAINMANIVLASSGVVSDAAKKSALEGEALFIRGILHFELVRLFALPWGVTANNDHLGIVIKTTATQTEEAAFDKSPRQSVAKVYQQVIADLTSAADKLPDDNGTRADKFTALAFLARVYLQKGDYANALTAADKVIESHKYRMNASVTAAFDNKNTVESIWEIQQNDQNNAGSSNDGMATFYASLPGIGRSDVRVLAPFLDTYDPADTRRLQLYYIGTGARPGSNQSGKWKSFSQNLPVIRIAEMYLIRAESNIRLGSAVGDTPENDLARVRNQIRTNLPEIANPTLEDVLTERSLELAFEGLRIHDLKRLHLSTGNFAWDSPKLVMPIPQRDVDASEGVIVQNPGY